MLVKFNAPRLLGFKDVFIKPGVNDLDEEFVADMMEDSVLAHKFEIGELEIIDREDIGAEKVVGKNGQAPSGVDVLLGATEKKATELAGQTVDTDILKTWFKKEKRGPVKAAIKAQWNKIKNIKFRDEKDKVKFEKGKDS